MIRHTGVRSGVRKNMSVVPPTTTTSFGQTTVTWPDTPNAAVTSFAVGVQPAERELLEQRSLLALREPIEVFAPSEASIITPGDHRLVIDGKQYDVEAVESWPSHTWLLAGRVT